MFGFEFSHFPLNGIRSVLALVPQVCYSSILHLGHHIHHKQKKQRKEKNFNARQVMAMSRLVYK